MGTMWVFALKKRNVAVGWILISSVVFSRLLMGCDLFGLMELAEVSAGLKVINPV